MTHLLTLVVSFPVSWAVGSEVSLSKDVLVFWASFNPFNITNYIEISWSVMQKPVFLILCRRLTRSTTTLTDQIWAKYEQLDSGEYGAVGTPAFNTEACELANLLAHVSQLHQKLNLLTTKELYRPKFFKYWRHFLDQNYTRQVVCLGYFKNWELAVHLACNYPCSFDKSKKVNKAAYLDWLAVNH